MLADHQIRAAHQARLDGRGRYVGEHRGLSISGYLDDHLNPASYDLTLSANLRLFRHTSEPLDVAEVPEGHTKPHDMRLTRGSFVLSPGDFILGATNEVVTLPDDLSARVEGKSSIGRLGIVVHTTAGFIDPGFSGSITLEMANLSPRPIRLRMGMRICQIAFTPMSGAAQRPYSETGHYQGQPAGEPVESRYRLNGWLGQEFRDRFDEIAATPEAQALTVQCDAWSELATRCEGPRGHKGMHGYVAPGSSVRRTW